MSSFSSHEYANGTSDGEIEPELGPDPLDDWIDSHAERPYPDERVETGGPFAKYDLFGRRIPRVMGIPDYLVVIAKADPGRVREIPARAIAEEFPDADEPHALVVCPCDHAPVATASLTRCPGCERYYTYVGAGSVWVVYGNCEVP